MALEILQPRRNFGTADTSRCYSPNVWRGIPISNIRSGDISGTFFEDDFIDAALAGTQTTEIGYAGRYKVFNTGATKNTYVTSINSVETMGGYLEISLDTDNDTGSLAQTQGSMLWTGNPSTSGLGAFEARIAWSPVVTNGIGWFVGLAEVDALTLVTAVPFNAGDGINATDTAAFVGFRKPEDDTTTYDSVYSDRAVTFTNVGDAEGTGAAAFTFVKLGIRHDPRSVDRCITYYINNIELTSAVTRATWQALTYCDAQPLGFLLSAVADSAGTTGKVYIDRVRCATMDVV